MYKLKYIDNICEDDSIVYKYAKYINEIYSLDRTNQWTSKFIDCPYIVIDKAANIVVAEGFDLDEEDPWCYVIKHYTRNIGQPKVLGHIPIHVDDYLDTEYPTVTMCVYDGEFEGGELVFCGSDGAIETKVDTKPKDSKMACVIFYGTGPTRH